jgi:hypothetical protein
MLKYLLNIDDLPEKEQVLETCLGMKFEDYIKLEAFRTILKMYSSADLNRKQFLRKHFAELWEKYNPDSIETQNLFKQKPPIKEILNQEIGYRLKWRLNRAFNGYGKLGARRCKCQEKPHLS